MINKLINDSLHANNMIVTCFWERKKEIKKNLLSAGKILGILEDDPGNWLGYNQKDTENTEEIERLINERNEARRSKNFNLADTIRDTLKDKGIEIEDTDKGTIWRKSRWVKR